MVGFSLLRFEIWRPFIVGVGSLIFFLGFLSGVKPFVPKSLSYENILRCYPELANPSWGPKLDLTQIKRQMDDKFATNHSYVQYRQVEFHDPSQKYIKANPNLGESPLSKGVGQRRMIISMQVGPTDKIETAPLSLKVEIADEKGEFVEVKNSRRTQPRPDEIANVLRGMVVDHDQSTYLDVKVDGQTLLSTSEDGVPRILTLRDSNRVLRCESAKELGVFCSCSKKNEK